MMSLQRVFFRVGRGVRYLVLIFIVLLWISPFLWMVMTSLRDPAEPFAAGLFPQRLVLTNYAKALQRSGLLVAFRNSFVVASLASLLSITLAIPASYGFSRFRFKGHRPLLVFLLIIKTLPGILLALAIFLIAGRIGLYDKHLPLILVNGMLNLPFAIWNMRTVFDGLNPEMEEAAMVDGCNRVTAIIRVLLPICTPGIMATMAFLFLLSWNEYLFALTFISSGSKVLVPPVIAGYVGQFAADYNGLITASVMASFPLILIFLVIQRYIIGGLSLGAVKG
jgi:multiple sugar transport system permease protein